MLVKSWRHWLCTLAAVCVAGFLSHRSTQGVSVGSCLLILTIIFLFGALTIAESQTQTASGFPAYMFLLPVGNFELVAWPMLLSALLLALTGAGIAFLVLSPVAAFASTWWVMPYLAGNVCLFQAVSWLPLKRPELRVTLTFVTVVSVVAGPIAFARGTLPSLPAGLLYFGLMVGSIAACVRGVGRARHGLVSTSTSSDKSHQIEEQPAFTSRVTTQVWFEEQRNGLIMKVLSAMFIAIVATIAILAVPDNPRFIDFEGTQISSMALGLAVLVLILPPYFGFGGCCASERDNISKDRSLLPFLALRPLTTLQIIEAKALLAVRTALRVARASLLVALGILLLPTSLDGHYQPTLIGLLPHLTFSRVLMFAAAYGLVLLGGIKAAVSGLWTSLGRLPVWAIMLVSVLPLIAVMGGAVWLVMTPDQVPAALAFAPKIIWIIAGVKLVCTSFAVVGLRRSLLVPDSLIVRYLVWAAVVGGLLFAFGCYVVPAAYLNRPALAAQIFCLLPLCRVALAPTFVHRGRHGG